MDRKILISNNSLFLSKQNNCLQKVILSDVSAYEILIKARDYIHRGHKLLTHPLYSSLKPNETPYRSIVLTEESVQSQDFTSTIIIEQALETYAKFSKGVSARRIDRAILKDFQVIDYDLINNALEN